MRSGLTDPSTYILAALAVVLAVVAYVKDPGLPALGIKNGLTLLWFVLPRLVPALILAGLMQVLVPQEVVARYFGHAAGLRALVIATFAGALTPGVPMVTVPLLVAAANSGAGMPALVDPAASVSVFLNPDRAELSRRIDARFDAMLEAGALEEVRVLDGRGLDPLCPAMKAHGVPWLRQVLAGKLTSEAAALGAKRDTKRYAKRQFTWFRHQLPEFAWMADREAKAGILRALKPLRA